MLHDVDGENAGGVEAMIAKSQGEYIENVVVPIGAGKAQFPDAPAPLQTEQRIRRSSRLRTKPWR